MTGYSTAVTLKSAPSRPRPPGRPAIKMTRARDVHKSGFGAVPRTDPARDPRKGLHQIAIRKITRPAIASHARPKTTDVRNAAPIHDAETLHMLAHMLAAKADAPATLPCKLTSRQDLVGDSVAATHVLNVRNAVDPRQPETVPAPDAIAGEWDNG